MIAFDTNVLIYACDQTAGRKHEIGRDLLASTDDGVLLWQVAIEFIAAFRKVAVDGDSATEAWQYLSEFMELLPLVVPQRGVLNRARQLHLESHGPFGTR